jgi:hypothetical protein
MDDRDHVFARFKDNKPASAERREKLTIPGRGSTSSSRSVEVVHARLSAVSTAKEGARRLRPPATSDRWESGLAVQQATRDRLAVEPDLVQAAKPTIHVMPAWEPTPVAAEVASSTGAEALVVEAVPVIDKGSRRTGKARRRVADPFDPADDGANCLHCGYVIERARDKRGLVTCVGCV